MSKKCIELEAAIEALVGLTIYDNAPALNAAVEKEYHNGREWIGGVRDALIKIGDLPAADVVEVRYGRWLSMDGDNTTVSLDEFGCPADSCRCSECGDWLTASDEYSVRGRYCPNCGAKMDGGQDDV